LGVVPGTSPDALVGVLPFHSPKQGYVSRSILGIQAKPLIEPHPTGIVTARIGFNEGIGAAQASLCAPVWYIGKHLAMQHVDGVEAGGETGQPFNADFGPNFRMSFKCHAHAVVRRGEIWELVDPLKPHRVPLPAGEIPPGYREFKAHSAEPLEAAIRGSADLFWLKPGPACQRWRFEYRGERIGEEGKTILMARLVLGKLRRTPKDTGGYRIEQLRYPVEYEFLRPMYGFAPRFKMSARQDAGRLPFGPHCSYEYAFLDVLDGALIMMGRTIDEPRDVSGPDEFTQLVAYDPEEAERWFLSRAECEAALPGIEQRLRADARVAPRLGFHAYELHAPD
jgi:hypothetical protein